MATVDQMDDQKTYFRHILYFFFLERVKTSGSAAWNMRRICRLGHKICILVSVGFHASVMVMSVWKIVPAQIVKSKRIMVNFWSAITPDWHISTRQIGKHLSIQHSTVARRLKNFGITKKMDNWIPMNWLKKIIESLYSLPVAAKKEFNEIFFE